MLQSAPPDLQRQTEINRYHVHNHGDNTVHRGNNVHVRDIDHRGDNMHVRADNVQRRDIDTHRFPHNRGDDIPHRDVDSQRFPNIHHHNNSNHQTRPPHGYVPEYQHTRQSSDSYLRENSDMYVDQNQSNHGNNHYVKRPQQNVRSHTPVERWQDNHLSYQTKPSYVRPESSGNYYSDSIFAYREPTYPMTAGKRPVHSITQPGSAKV